MDIKILVINLHSSCNAGDDVLTQVALNQLHTSFPNSEIILSMNDPVSFHGVEQTVGSFMTWLKPNQVNPGYVVFIKGLLRLVWSFWIAIGYKFIGRKVLVFVPNVSRPLLRAYFDADLVVSSAGNFLYTSGRFGFPFLIAFYTMFYAWLIGKPLYSMPQTIGPLTRNWEKALTRWIVLKMELLFVREAVSVQELKKINGWGENCFLVPDLAFGFPSADKQEAEMLLVNHGIVENSGVPLLGVTLINWEAQNLLFKNQAEYETAVCDVIRHFITHYNGDVVLFSQVLGPSFAEDDRIPARRIYGRLEDLHYHLKLMDEEVSPGNLKAAYGLMDVFMGTRLHSNIFALSEHIPVIAIQYQYKTRGIMQELGLGNWVVDIESINSKDLVDLFDKLWHEKIDLRSYLKNIMPGIVKQASDIADRIEKDFYDKFKTNQGA